MSNNTINKLNDNLKENINENLVSWLFETKAVRVCQENKPFWYTSGTIGPYYINTHFLYGNEEKANELLSVIDREKDNKEACTNIILDMELKNYEENIIYRQVIDTMIGYIRENIGKNEIEYISGGERRDWFFSIIVAHMLEKPHITIFKDLDCLLFDKGTASKEDKISSNKILHIADLITEASSYERAWIPAIRNLEGNIKWSLVVVDRLQGGASVLNNYKIASHALVNEDKALFLKAFEMGIIKKQQLDMIMAYIDDPHESMKIFIKEHPEFITESLNSDPKTVERAKLCIEKRIY